MNAELQTRLSKLGDNLRGGRLDRAALFWLKVFVDLALESDGEVHSDRWVEAGLAAADRFPGLNATALPPRRDLVADYDLFRLQRLRDGVEFIGPGLASLNWARKYRVGLLPALANSLPELHEWVEEMWAELGGVSPRFAALEEVLVRQDGQGRSALLEILHETQSIFDGWLPQAAVERVAAALEVPTADVYGVTEFYEMFHTHPIGRKVIHVCQGAPCALAKVGGTIGAGTIMVFDDTVDLRQVLRRIADFFAHESCGQCYPCQMGTARQAEIMARVAQGQTRPDDAGALLDLGAVMTDTSICGLGQTAALAVVDAHRHWPELFEPV